MITIAIELELEVFYFTVKMFYIIEIIICQWYIILNSRYHHFLGKEHLLAFDLVRVIIVLLLPIFNSLKSCFLFEVQGVNKGNIFLSPSCQTLTLGCSVNKNYLDIQIILCKKTCDKTVIQRSCPDPTGTPEEGNLVYE